MTWVTAKSHMHMRLSERLPPPALSSSRDLSETCIVALSSSNGSLSSSVLLKYFMTSFASAISNPIRASSATLSDAHPEFK